MTAINLTSTAWAMSRRQVIAIATILAFVLALPASTAGRAQAASNNQILQGIGVGIAAGIILQGLSKSGGKVKKRVGSAKPRIKPVQSVKAAPSVKPVQSARAPVRIALPKAKVTFVARLPQKPKVAVSKSRISPNAAVVARTPAAVQPISVGTTGPLVSDASAADIITTPDEILAAQQHLQTLGYDVPEPDGLINVRTKSAVLLFQESIKAPITGDLTREQLLLLFQKVAKQDQPAQ